MPSKSKTASNATPSKKGQAAESKKPQSSPAPSHPTYNKMISEAIIQLKERKGSSKKAIQKYIFSKYHVEENSRNNALINRVLRGMLEKKEIVHAVGQKTTGASGRFRVPGKESGEKARKSSPSKPKVKKASPVKAAPASPKKSPPKKSPKKGKK